MSTDPTGLYPVSGGHPGYGRSTTEKGKWHNHPS